MNKILKIKNIDQDIVKNDLIKLGFQLIKANENNRLANAYDECDMYFWFNGHKRHGNENPTLMIFGNTGLISFYMSSTYYYQNIPSVLLDLFNKNMIELECIEEN